VNKQELQEAVAVAHMTDNIYVRIETKVDAAIHFLLTAKNSSADLAERVEAVEALLNVSEDDLADAETAVTVLETLVQKVANIESFLQIGHAESWTGTDGSHNQIIPLSGSHNHNAQGGAGDQPTEAEASQSEPTDTEGEGEPSLAPPPSSPSSEYLCCVDQCPQAQDGNGTASWEELAAHAASAHGAELHAVEGGYVYRLLVEPSASGVVYDVMPERLKLEKMNIDTLLTLGERHGIQTPDRSEGKRAIIDALTGSKE
jgi:hypothetical protein